MRNGISILQEAQYEELRTCPFTLRTRVPTFQEAVARRAIGQHACTTHIARHDGELIMYEGSMLFSIFCLIITPSCCKVCDHPSDIVISHIQEPSAHDACFWMGEHLVDTGSGDGGRGALVLDGTGRGAASLNGLDNTNGGGVTGDDLAEDDVASVQPAGDNGGHEELGAVARAGVNTIVREKEQWGN